MKETKQARFKRLVEARVNKIISMLRLLGNCSFKGNYEYSDEQVEKVFQKLQRELTKTYNRYKCELHGKGRFSLTNPEASYSSDGYAFPSVILPLPNGQRLRASANGDEGYPAISIWLQSDDCEDEQSVAFVEYNCEHEKGQEIYIGVCSSDSEDPYMYVPFNKGEKNDG